MLHESIEESPTSGLDKSRRSLFDKRHYRRLCRSLESDSEANFNDTISLSNLLTQDSTTYLNNSHQQFLCQSSRQDLLNSENNEGINNNSPPKNTRIPPDENLQTSQESNNNQVQHSAIITNFRLFEAEMKLIMADCNAVKSDIGQNFPETQGFTTLDRLYEQIPEADNTVREAIITPANVNNRIINPNHSSISNMNMDCGSRTDNEFILSVNSVGNGKDLVNKEKSVYDSKILEPLVFNTRKKTPPPMDYNKISDIDNLSLMDNTSIVGINYEENPAMESEIFFTMDYATPPEVVQKTSTNMYNQTNSKQDKLISNMNNLSQSNMNSTVVAKINDNSTLCQGTSIVESILADFQEDDNAYSPLSSPRWLSRSPLFMLLEKPKRCYERRNNYERSSSCKTEAKNISTSKLFNECNDDVDSVYNDDDIHKMEIATTESNTSSNMSPIKDLDVSSSLSNGTQRLQENLMNISSYFMNKTMVDDNSDNVHDDWSNLAIWDRNDEFLATPDYENKASALNNSKACSQLSVDTNDQSRNLCSEENISKLIDELIRLKEYRQNYEKEDSFSSTEDFVGFCQSENDHQSVNNLEEKDEDQFDFNLQESISSSFEIDPEEISSNSTTILEKTIINNPEININESFEATEDVQLQTLFRQLESNQIPVQYLEELNRIEFMNADEVESSENFKNWYKAEDHFVDDRNLQQNVEKEKSKNRLEAMEPQDVLIQECAPIISVSENSVPSKKLNGELEKEAELVHLKELSLIDEIDVDNWHDENDFFMQQPTTTTSKNTEIKSEMSTIPKQVGFQTAAGRNINVSKAAQKAVENLLKDFQEDIENNTVDHEKELHAMKMRIQKTRCSQVEVNTNYLDKSAGNFKSEIATTSIGFQTAHGKSIQVSKKAIQSVQHILQEFQSNNIMSNDNVENEIEVATRELGRIKMEIRGKHQKEQKSNDKSLPVINNQGKNLTPTTKLSLSQSVLSKTDNKIKIEAGNEKQTTSLETVKENSFLLTDCENILFSEWPFSPENLQSSSKETPKTLKLSPTISINKMKRKRSIDNSEPTSPCLNECKRTTTSSQLNDDLEIASPLINKNNEVIPAVHLNEAKVTSPANNNIEKPPSPGLNKTSKATSIPNYLDKVKMVLPSPQLRRHLKDSSSSQKSAAKIRLRRKNSSPLVKTPKRSIIARKNILSLNKKRKEQQPNWIKIGSTLLSKTVIEAETQQNSGTNETGPEEEASLGNQCISALSPSSPDRQDFIRSVGKRMQREAGDFLTSTPQSVCRTSLDSTPISSRQLSQIMSAENTNVNLNDSISALESTLCSKEAQGRIDRLNMYGEAPTITPLRLNTSNKCRSSGLRRTRSAVFKPLE